MKKLWKVLAIALSLAMCLGLCANAVLTTRFEDVEADKFYTEAFDLLKVLKVFNGYEDGSVKPEALINRAEFATLLYTALTGEQNADFLKGYSDFADCDPDGWYMGFVNYAIGEGIMSGYDDGTMKPMNNITVAEVSRMIVSALGFKFDKIIWPSTFMSTAKTQGLFNGITESFTANTKATRGFVAVMLYNALFLDNVKYNTTLNQNIQQVGSSIMERVFGYVAYTGVVKATNNLYIDDNYEGVNGRVTSWMEDECIEDYPDNCYYVEGKINEEGLDLIAPQALPETSENYDSGYFFVADSKTQMDDYLGTVVKVFYKEASANLHCFNFYAESICIPQQGTVERFFTSDVTIDTTNWDFAKVDGVTYKSWATLEMNEANTYGGDVVGEYCTYCDGFTYPSASYRVFVANGAAYITPGAVGRLYYDAAAKEYGLAPIETADANLKTDATSFYGLEDPAWAQLNIGNITTGSYVEYYFDGAVLDATKLTKSTVKYNAYSEGKYKFGDNWFENSAFQYASSVQSNNPTAADTVIYVDSFGKIAYAAVVAPVVPGATYSRMNWAVLKSFTKAFVFNPATGLADAVYTFKAVNANGEFTGTVASINLYGTGVGGNYTWTDAKWYTNPYIYYVDAATGAYTFNTIFGNWNCLGSTYYPVFGGAPLNYKQELLTQTITEYTNNISVQFPGMAGNSDIHSGFTGVYSGVDAHVINTGSFIVFKNISTGLGQIMNLKSDAVFFVMTTANGQGDGAVSAVNVYTPATLPQGVEYQFQYAAMDAVTPGYMLDVVYLTVAPAAAPAPTAISEFVITNRVVTVNAEDATKWDVTYSYCKLDGTTGTLVVAGLADPMAAQGAFAVGSFAEFDGTAISALDRSANVALYYPGTINGWYYFYGESLAPTQYGIAADVKVYVIAADGSVRTGTTADIKYCAHVQGTAVPGSSITSVAMGAGWIYVYNVRITTATDAATGLQYISTMYIYEANCAK